jgi:hypothetical protein
MYGLRGPNAEGNYATCCPFCLAKTGNPDTKFKLTIKVSGETKTTAIPLSPENGAYNCYRCSGHGIGDFRWIGELADLPDPAAAPPAPPDLGPPEGFLPIASHMFDKDSGPLQPYVAYLLQRGVLANAIAASAGACTKGKWRGRVVLPVKDAAGRWLGFSARLIEDRPPLSVRAMRPSANVPIAYDERPKYLYPPGMDRRKMLWGLETLPPAPSPAWVVEGVFDALPLFPNALATFGKNVTDEQVEMLAGLERPIVVCLDGDAWTLARSLAARLRLRRVDATWCQLPPGSDPGQLGWNVARFIVQPK